ncbi:unnamed protein product [Paramecium sonneborni]|uniref:Protein kinase domain-containing protein n=1 Tax=Paramecium sonneborni TaxID=65129 RepID=A0A8S1R2M5_9CILI|nr:unnamed protein product [Paramecium sonneborni]
MMTELRGDYLVRFDKQLGKGSFGSAYYCYRQDNPKEEFCIKIIKKSELNDPKKDSFNKKQIQAEIMVVKNLQHSDSENLVKLIDFLESSQELCIIMELCDYNLYQQQNQLKKQQQWFTRQEQIDIISQILKGARVLIENKFVHRDIKPQNILVKVINKGLPNQRRIYKLADFGLVRALDDIYKKSDLTRVGTFLYCAPEIVHNLKFSAKCDIFSYGVVFHQIVFNGAFPYNYSNEQQMRCFLKKIQKEPFNCKKLQDEQGNMLTDLIDKMLLYNQDDRISFEKLLNHQIVTIKSSMQDSLLINIERKFDKEEMETQMNDNQQSKFDKIYCMIDFFYRKYLLCQSVFEYIKKTLNINNPNFFIISQIIGKIGLEEIKFAFAMLFIIVADFQNFIKNEHDVHHLNQILINYLEYSNNSQKDQDLHQKIKKSFYFLQKEIQNDYNSQISNLQKLGNNNQLKQLIDFLKESQFKKIQIQIYCQTLQEFLNSQQINLEVFNQQIYFIFHFRKIQKNIQNIITIETKYEIQKYYFINPDEIFEIKNQ